MARKTDSNEGAIPESDTKLLQAYLRVGVPTDELPYTEAMDRLLAAWGEVDATPSIAFQRLLYLRKTGQAPPLAVFGPIPGLPRLSDTDVDMLSRLVIEFAGSIGRRDRLPYSLEFDQLHSEFERVTGTTISKRDLWLLILRRAKTGVSRPKPSPAGDQPDEE